MPIGYAQSSRGVVNRFATPRSRRGDGTIAHTPCECGATEVTLAAYLDASVLRPEQQPVSLPRWQTSNFGSLAAASSIRAII